MNIRGMVPLENQVAKYIRDTGNHVLYRVTPIFEGDDLLAAGVLMEALSVEDDGQGVQFCVFAYNAQPYIDIDYATGDSARAETAPEATAEPSPAPEPSDTPSADAPTADYIVNTKSGRFHLPNCSGVRTMAEGNKLYYTGSRDDLIAQNYTPCGQCKP